MSLKREMFVEPDLISDASYVTSYNHMMNLVDHQKSTEPESWTSWTIILALECPPLGFFNNRNKILSYLSYFVFSPTYRVAKSQVINNK